MAYAAESETNSIAVGLSIEACAAASKPNIGRDVSGANASYGVWACDGTITRQAMRNNMEERSFMIA
jgi:hypothetical protein